MPTESFDHSTPQYKCEGCSFKSRDRKEVKRHIYESRKDRNKSDKRRHR